MNSQHPRVTLVTTAVVCAVVVMLAASAASAAKVDIHGFMLNRFYYDPGEAHFEVERIGLQASAPLADDVKTLIEWYYHNWAPSDKLWLESAYVDFDNVYGGRLRAGRGRSYVFGITPTGGTRRTSEYGLVSETFTMDRIEGLQYMRDEKDGWAWAAGVYNGYSLGRRPTMDLHIYTPPHGGEHTANAHLTDRENNQRDVLEVAAKLTKHVNPSLQVDFSVRGGEISVADVAFVNDNFNANWTSRTKLRYGLDAIYKKGEWMSNAELYLAKTSELDHIGYAILVGYEPKNPAAMKAYVRYGVSDLDLSAADLAPASPGALSDQLTADHEQWMLSLIQPIRPGVWVEFAYIINDQDTVAPGVSMPENDIGFVELFTGF